MPFFPSKTHFGHQELRMEVPGDFQEHFEMILTRFGAIIGNHRKIIGNYKEIMVFLGFFAFFVNY